MRHALRSSVVVMLLILLAISTPAGAQVKPAVKVTGDGGTVTATANVSVEHMSLRIATPDGFAFETEGATSTISLSPFGIPRYTPPDGSYVYEVRLLPRGAIDPAIRARAKEARESGDVGPEHQLRLALNRSTVLVSGGFQIVNGRIVLGGAIEPQTRTKSPFGAGTRSPFTPASIESERENFIPADQVIPDDLIVQGSLCVGLDCVNNENFGFDTIRLKENNTRIKFEDTSVGSFPTNDWQLTANESASGGQSKFSIEDITGARVPFTVEAGATTNSLYVDSTGRIGLRTSAPVLDLHINTSNTPAIRLEQNSSGGFTAQTWDIGANEANFFVRDVTSGSRLPFRIRPGAPTSSIDISADGDVGIGTASPDARLDVSCSVAGAACVKIQNSSATGFSSVEYFDDGGTIGLSIGLDNAANTARFNSVNNNPIVLLTNSVEHVRVTTAGDVGINCNAPSADLHIASGAGCANPASSINAGSANFTVSSSRTIKENLSAVQVPNILDKVAGVGVFTFDFVNGPRDRIGFVAEEFHRVFGRGSDKLIAGDEVQVALWLAVQQLIVRSRELQQENAKLREEIDAIKVSQPLYSRHRKD